jgi:hypothetical protein
MLGGGRGWVVLVYNRKDMQTHCSAVRDFAKRVGG